MEDNKKGKHFSFPEDVQADYNIVAGVSLKNFVLTILPFTLVGIGIVLIPPYTTLLLIIRISIGAMVALTGLAIVIAKPIPERRNITLLNWLKQQQHFRNRTKLFYIKKQKKDHF